MVNSEDIKMRRQMGKNLKEIRESRKLTQQEVAEKAEINVTHYAKIERGENFTTTFKLRRICKVLKVKSSDILPF